MEAPDKIYLHPDIGGKEFIRPWLKRAANSESIAYIRKDALLEWAKEKKTCLEKLFDASPTTAIGAKIDVSNELINKLDSM